MLRSGHEQAESLRLSGAESSLSSNSRVCLLNLMLGAVILDRQVALRVVRGAMSSVNDTLSLSFCLRSDAFS